MLQDELPSPEEAQHEMRDLVEAVSPSVLEWIGENQKSLLLGLVGFLVFVWFVRRVRRWWRRRGGPRLHPKLQKYGADYDPPEEALLKKRRAEAARIVATSSTGSIVGYEIVEQVEAVFVEGFRRPEDALEGLKAVAGMKGANAVVNVRQEGGGSGKRGASGDAVVVRRTGSAAAPSRGSGEAPRPGDAARDVGL